MSERERENAEKNLEQNMLVGVYAILLGVPNGILQNSTQHFCTFVLLLLFFCHRRRRRVLPSLPTLYSVDTKCAKKDGKRKSNITAERTPRMRRIRKVDDDDDDEEQKRKEQRSRMRVYREYNGAQANKCMFIAISLSSAVLCSCFHVVRASLQSQFTRHLWCVKELSHSLPRSLS